MENKKMEIYVSTTNEYFVFYNPHKVNTSKYFLRIDKTEIKIKDIIDISLRNGTHNLKILIDLIVEQMNERIEVEENPEQKRFINSLRADHKEESKDYGFSADSLGIIIESKEYEKLKDLTTFLKENGYKIGDLHYGFKGDNELNQYIFTFDPKGFNESLKEQMYEEDRINFKPIKFRKMIGEE